MGLTFRKRDDFDKMMDTLGVSNVDLVSLGDDLTTKK
ncbi:SPJ_0845 family protein [Lactococcus fujiensis]|nr:SPJ_0845 family protein [Lactococcus fujiensis]